MSFEFLQAETADAMPRVLPPGWEQPVMPGSGNVLMNHAEGIGVIISVERIDGEKWLHVSASRQSRVPSWADMMYVKQLFIGKGRKAIQVMPPTDEHVNTHPFVLHLWCNLERDPLPDFRREGTL